MELKDVHIAIRSLLRHRSYSVPAALTLALGVGATTAVFSVVYAVLLRPLPFQNSEKLIRVYATRSGEQWTSSPPNFVDIRNQSRSFDSMGAFYGNDFALTGGQRDAEQVPGAVVTSSLFPTLGIDPAIGRGFTTAVELPGQDKVVLLSDGLWKRRFGGSREILGKPIRIDGTERIVMGVLPAGSFFPPRAELWVPMAFTAEGLQKQRGSHYLHVIARLRGGATLASANAELRTLAQQLAEAYPDQNREWSAEAISLNESIVGNVQRPLLVLLVAVALLLLIACLNVTNLTLAHGLTRARDLAIRAAIGAGRARLAMEMIVESVILALAGGAAASMIAIGALELLTTKFPQRIPRLADAELSLPVLAVGLFLSLVTGVLVGIIPALEISRSADLTHRLKESGQSISGDRRAHRLRGLLVISEVALAVLLLTAAGLMLKSFVRLAGVETGFATDKRLTFNISLPESRYQDVQQIRAFVSRLINELRTIPEVESAAAVFGLPLSGFDYSIALTQLDGVSVEDRNDLSVQVRIITPDYYRVLGIPLVKGRQFLESDAFGTPGVVIVNESAAQKLWPGQDPMGRTLELGTRFGTGKRIGGTVVGMVRNVLHDGAAFAPAPEAYFPHRQVPADYLSVVLKTRRTPAAVIAAARAKLRALDPELPMYGEQTMDQLASESIASTRFYASLINFFGGLALVLAAIGIYGVIAFSVDRRTREIGIRMVLGAKPGDVLRQVIGQGAGLTTVGVIAGILGAVSVSRLLGGLLFRTEPTDPWTYAGVAATLMLIALAATYIPARRAMRVEPITALRYE